MEESDQSTDKTEPIVAEYRAPGTETPCQKCVYKRPVPDNAHVECVYNWTRALTDKKVTIIPLGHTHGVQQGWYMFPILFDPIWMVIKCQAASQIIDENYVLGEDKPVIQTVILKYILDHPLTVKKVEAETGGKEDVESKGTGKEPDSQVK